MNYRSTAVVASFPGLSPLAFMSLDKPGNDTTAAGHKVVGSTAAGHKAVLVQLQDIKLWEVQLQGTKQY